jgi:hypothetical protein
MFEPRESRTIQSGQSWQVIRRWGSGGFDKAAASRPSLVRLLLECKKKRLGLTLWVANCPRNLIPGRV